MATSAGRGTSVRCLQVELSQEARVAFGDAGVEPAAGAQWTRPV